MGSRNLVICDREQEYAAAFAAYLLKKQELALQVQVCQSLEQVKRIREKSEIQVLLLSEDYSEEERNSIDAEQVFILTERAGGRQISREGADSALEIYRYQSAEMILAEIFGKCSEREAFDGLFFTKVRTQKMEIIGVFSPCHRCGKTRYALELGKKLASEANVLYLNMEVYGGIGGYFSEEGPTIADALYYARQEKQDLGVILTTLVTHMGEMDYLLPVKVSEDLKGVTGEEWIDLLRQIAQCGLYDVLILDLDEGLQEVYQILRFCTQVQVIELSDPVSQAKLLQFDRELHLLGYEDVRRKLTRQEGHA